MSVQAQIDRISSNVTAALAKIAEKGVTVPSMANSDDLAELIAAIEAGGGGGTIISGEITIAEDCTQVPITHGFDDVPKVFFAFYDAVSPNAGNAVHLVGVTYDVDRAFKWYSYAGYSTRNGNYDGRSGASQRAPTSASGEGYYIFKSSNTTLTLNKGNTNGFTAGQKYIWIAMG